MANQPIKSAKRTTSVPPTIVIPPLAQAGGAAVSPALEPALEAEAAKTGKRPATRKAAPKTKTTVGETAPLASEGPTAKKATPKRAAKKENVAVGEVGAAVSTMHVSASPVHAAASPVHAAGPIAIEPLEAEIAREAYLMAEREGFPEGRECDHWWEAERLVLARHAAAVKQ